jgi:succinate dehydrogenase / fumarate reductase cytochrome b subunit
LVWLNELSVVGTPISRKFTSRSPAPFFCRLSGELIDMERPVNIILLPTRFRWPLTALASILHRITGVLLFGGIAMLLYLADLALGSAESFEQAAIVAHEPLPRLLLLGLLGVLLYHFFAGIKHLLLDFHIGETMESAKTGVYLVFAATIVSTLALGVLLW